MSILDFLFPEQAQASHLRGLLRHQQLEAVRERYDRRAVAGEENRRLMEKLGDLEDQVDNLSVKLSESELLIKALTEVVIQSTNCTKEDLVDIISEIDLSDGVQDGRVTPDSERPKRKFVAKRSWED